METDLPPAGTGQRVQQLKLFGEFASFIEKRRSWECEAAVQAAGPHPGERLCKAVPPYIKWPLWRVKPQRQNESPSFSFKALQAHGGAQGAPSRRMVATRSFNLLTVPRVVAEVTYLAGELGSQDRRTLCALSQNAVETGRDDLGYVATVRRLFDLLGVSRRSRRNHEDLAASLWRLSRTALHLNSRDELAQTWGTQGFFLVPRVETRRVGREWIVEYDFPAAANDLIARNALCTVDVHRLRAMSSPAAESLYCVLYDVAQWSSLQYIAYPLPDILQRLGMAPHATVKNGRTYYEWSRAIAQIRRASEQTYRVGQCITDYEVEGRGAESWFRFFFASGPSRKIHLPPSRYE